MSRTFPLAIHDSWGWTEVDEGVLAELRAGAVEALEMVGPDGVRVEAAAFVGMQQEPCVRVTAAREGNVPQNVEITFNLEVLKSEHVRDIARAVVAAEMARLPA